LTPLCSDQLEPEAVLRRLDEDRHLVAVVLASVMEAVDGRADGRAEDDAARDLGRERHSDLLSRQRPKGREAQVGQVTSVASLQLAPLAGCGVTPHGDDPVPAAGGVRPRGPRAGRAARSRSPSASRSAAARGEPAAPGTGGTSPLLPLVGTRVAPPD